MSDLTRRSVLSVLAGGAAATLFSKTASAQNIHYGNTAKDLLRKPFETWSEEISRLGLNQDQKLTLYDKLVREVNFMNERAHKEMTKSWTQATRGRWFDITRNVRNNVFKDTILSFNRAVGTAKANGTLTAELHGPEGSVRATHNTTLQAAYDDCLRTIRSTLGISQSSLDSGVRTASEQTSRRGLMGLGGGPPVA